MDFVIYIMFILSSCGGIIGQNRVNIALNKPATQSSTFGHYQANLGVDGFNNNNMLNNFCMHTNNDDPAWWMVDLGAIYNISEIVLYHRGDCCRNRIKNFLIDGAVDNLKDFSNCFTQVDIPPLIQFIELKDCIARFVRLSIPDSSSLQFCEMEIYGTPDTSSISTDTSSITTDTSSITTDASTITTDTSTITTDTSSITTDTSSITTDTSSITTDTSSITTDTFSITTDTSPKTAEASVMLKLCECRCVVDDNAAIAGKIQEIKDKLYMEPRKLSSYVRRKTSAKDDRAVATSVGYIGFLLLVAAFVVITLGDIITAVKFIMYLSKKTVTNWCN